MILGSSSLRLGMIAILAAASVLSVDASADSKFKKFFSEGVVEAFPSILNPYYVSKGKLELSYRHLRNGTAKLRFNYVRGENTSGLNLPTAGQYKVLTVLRLTNESENYTRYLAGLLNDDGDTGLLQIDVRQVGVLSFARLTSIFGVGSTPLGDTLTLSESFEEFVPVNGYLSALDFAAIDANTGLHAGSTSGVDADLNADVRIRPILSTAVNEAFPSIGQFDYVAQGTLTLGTYQTEGESTRLFFEYRREQNSSGLALPSDGQYKVLSCSRSKNASGKLTYVALLQNKAGDSGVLQIDVKSGGELLRVVSLFGKSDTKLGDTLSIEKNPRAFVATPANSNLSILETSGVCR